MILHSNNPIKLLAKDHLNIQQFEQGSIETATVSFLIQIGISILRVRVCRLRGLLEDVTDDVSNFGTVKALLKRPELTQNVDWCFKNDL